MEEKRPNTHLRHERELKGWSQRKLAELLGTNEQVVNRWESGQHKPNRHFQTQLCQLFGKNAEELGFMDEPQKTKEVCEHTIVNTEEVVKVSSVTSVLPSNQLINANSDFSQTIKQGIIEELRELSSQSGGTLFELPHASSSIPSLFRIDIDVLSRLSSVLNKSSVLGEKEIIYFDQQTRLYWRAREESVFPANILYIYVIRHIDDITILLARSLLPTLRLYLCEMVCRTVLLAGVLLYDMGQYVKARQQYQIAFQAATEANNSILQAIVWGWISFTWTYTKHYTKALHCVRQARHFASQTSDLIVQAWLGAVEAEIQAHLQNREACLQSLTSSERGFSASPSQNISYLFEFNPVLLLGYKGICLQQFYQKQEPTTRSLLQEAKEALEQALTGNAPTKRKLYYMSDLAAVHARQGEVEIACTYIIQSIPLILQVGSGSKTIYQHLLQVRTLLQPYEHTPSIQLLDEQMATLYMLQENEGLETLSWKHS